MSTPQVKGPQVDGPDPAGRKPERRAVEGGAPKRGPKGAGSPKQGRVHLAPGEQVALELRSHWYTLVGPALVLVVASGVGSFLAATVPPSDARATLRWIIGGTALALVLRWAVWPFLVWYANSYVLTTRRLIIREGVLARRGHDIPLVRITDTSFTRSLLQRLLGCGRLTITTAGARGAIVIDDVPLIADVQRVIAGLVGAAPRPPGAAGAQAEGAPEERRRPGPYDQDAPEHPHGQTWTDR